MKYLFYMAVVSLTLSLSCKKEKKDIDLLEPEYIISKDAIVFEDENDDFVLLDPNKIKISDDILMDTIEVGDILVSGTNSKFPNGFFGKVIQINQAGDNIEVSTEPASLTDAIEKCSVRYRENFSPDDTLRSAEFNLSLDYVLFDSDGDLTTKDDQIKMNGEISTEVDLIFELDIDNFSLTYFRAGFVSTDNGTISLSSEVKNKIFSKQKALASYNFTPINIQVGIFPIVIFPALVFRVGGDGEIKAEMSISTERVALFQAAVKYEEGAWAKDIINTTTYVPINVNLNGEISGEVYIKSGLEFYLYNHKDIKSSIYLKPYISAEAECNTNDFECGYELSAGLELSAEIKVEILDRSLINYSNEFFDESIIFDEGTTNPTSGSFIDDRDGKEYDWTKIGDQIWMAESLRFEASESLCWDNEPANCSYGRLYSQSALADACPNGWKAPSIEDFVELFETNGGLNNNNDKLLSSVYNGTNESGFNLKPGGYAGYYSNGLQFPVPGGIESLIASWLITTSVSSNGGDITFVLYDSTQDSFFIANQFETNGVIPPDAIIINAHMPCRCIKE